MKKLLSKVLVFVCLLTVFASSHSVSAATAYEFDYSNCVKEQGHLHMQYDTSALRIINKGEYLFFSDFNESDSKWQFVKGTQVNIDISSVIKFGGRILLINESGQGIDIRNLSDANSDIIGASFTIPSSGVYSFAYYNSGSDAAIVDYYDITATYPSDMF